MSDHTALEAAKADPRNRAEDCALAQDALRAAIAAAVQAEVGYLEAAYAVVVAEGGDGKRTADLNERMRYLRTTYGPAAIGTAAAKIVDTSKRRRIFGF